MNLVGKKMKNNESLGGIWPPVVFIIALLFGSYLLGSTLNIKSQTGEENVTYTIADQQSSNSKALQMTKVSFSTPIIPSPPPSSPPPSSPPPSSPPPSSPPTPAEDVCNHDQYKKADPDRCFCTEGWLTRCERNLCKEINYSKSGGGDRNSMSCAILNGLNPSKCEAFGKEGDGWYCIGKPVIYLYPTAPTLVNVGVITEGKIVVSDPQIEIGDKWTNVLAMPDGILHYNNKQYRELFYETGTTTVRRPKAGIIVDKKNLKTELLSFITQLGLSRQDEQQEFLDWWVPRLENINSEKLFVSILENDEKKRLDQVTISPKPDTFIDFIVYFAPLSQNETVTPLVLPEAPKRVGFTAIEWGGVIGK
jgi:hypothetical protein